jgi:hypothetical protein
LSGDFQLARRLAASALLALLVVVTISVWLLDLVAMQRAFGFLLSADLLAFAMLVYTYDRESDEQVNWPLLLVGSAFVAILIFFSVVTP